MEIIAITGDLCLRGKKITSDIEGLRNGGTLVVACRNPLLMTYGRPALGGSKVSMSPQNDHVLSTHYGPRSLKRHLSVSHQLYSSYYCSYLMDEETESRKVSINYSSSC